MKVEFQQSEFKPVCIHLETREELRDVIAALTYGFVNFKVQADKLQQNLQYSRVHHSIETVASAAAERNKAVESVACIESLLNILREPTNESRR